MLEELRFALRSLGRHRAFTFVVVLTVALGIAANTVMFTIVNAVLLRPLPYARPDRLVSVWETRRGDRSDRDRGDASYLDFLDWRREHSIFAALQGYDETLRSE